MPRVSSSSSKKFLVVKRAPQKKINQPGSLKKFGYENTKDLSVAQRHEALTKAVRSYGAQTVHDKLDSLVTYMKNKNPQASRRFARDRNWLQREYASQIVIKD